LPNENGAKVANEWQPISALKRQDFGFGNSRWARSQDQRAKNWTA